MEVSRRVGRQLGPRSKVPVFLKQSDKFIVEGVVELVEPIPT